jgi:hypothetical protein
VSSLGALGGFSAFAAAAIAIAPLWRNIYDPREIPGALRVGLW